MIFNTLLSCIIITSSKISTVPHPGYFEIYLSEMVVGRDTSDDDANWII